MDKKIAVSTAFYAWLSEAKIDLANEVIGALKTISKNNLAVGEQDNIDFQVRKLPNEAPSLYRLRLLKVSPEIAILYGLVGEYIVPGAWGDVRSILHPSMLKLAQDVINQFKESDHV